MFIYVIALSGWCDYSRRKTNTRTQRGIEVIGWSTGVFGTEDTNNSLSGILETSSITMGGVAWNGLEAIDQSEEIG